MNSKQQVKTKLGHVVQIHVCRLTWTWCLTFQMSSARAWASVILAGIRDSRRHCTTSFSENVEVTETKYQMLKVLSFCDRQKNSANFSS